MNTLKELQDDHINTSAEIDRVKREIQEESTKNNSTRNEIAVIKQNIQALIVQSKNARKLRFEKKFTSAQIVEWQKQLQIEIGQKEIELKGLENDLASNSLPGLSGLLQNELKGYNQKLSFIRSEIVKLQLESLANEITGAAGEPLRKMALYLLSDQTPREESGEIYRTIGAEICKKIFGEQNRHHAKLPSTVYAKQQVSKFIGEQL